MACRGTTTDPLDPRILRGQLHSEHQTALPARSSACSGKAAEAPGTPEPPLPADLEKGQLTLTPRAGMVRLVTGKDQVPQLPGTIARPAAPLGRMPRAQSPAPQAPGRVHQGRPLNSRRVLRAGSPAPHGDDAPSTIPSRRRGVGDAPSAAPCTPVEEMR